MFDKLRRSLIACPAGLSGAYDIPGCVISIEDDAFSGCCGLASVSIPQGVTRIGADVFYGCPSLEAVCFQGGAPSVGGNVFSGSSSIVYYLPGTAGWGSTFAGVPTAPWYPPNPVILGNGAGLGVRTNQFGFNISWATNASVVVEACTNLAQARWFAVSTNTLLSGTTYFSDPQWTDYSCCLYQQKWWRRRELNPRP